MGMGNGVFFLEFGINSREGFFFVYYIFFCFFVFCFLVRGRDKRKC